MLPVFVLAVLGHFAYFQSVNVGLVWIADHVQLSTWFGDVPVPWFASIDPLAGILFAPLLIAFWAALAARNAEPGDIQKIGIGLTLMAAGMAVFAVGAASSGEEGAGLIWPLLAYVFTGLGFFWYWPVLLSFVSRVAPPSVRSLLMGTAYLSLFFAGLLAGYVGSLYEALTPMPFFFVCSAIPIAGAVFVLLFGGRLQHALQATGAHGETS